MPRAPQIPPRSPIDGPTKAAVTVTKAARANASKVKVRHRCSCRLAYAWATSTQAASLTGCPVATAVTIWTRAEYGSTNSGPYHCRSHQDACLPSDIARPFPADQRANQGRRPEGGRPSRLLAFGGQVEAIR